ncbi:MAG: hypothetical protein RR290_02810 [Clostridia bacterium]
MLYKKMFVNIIITFITISILSISNIYATDENSNIKEDIQTQKVVESQVKKITDIQYESINKLLEYINNELKIIDDKILESKKMHEFDKYPAVRLNIDTPYFGISSIIEAKLKIRDKVSAVDIASGYGIRDVVNKKNIKVESFEVSNIIVITRDVIIDKEMTYSDAQICIFKLINYLDQVKSANKFLDKQLFSMISSYLLQEKTEVISKINEKIIELNDTLNSSLNELSYIINVCELDVNSDITLLYNFKSNLNKIDNITKNILSSKKILDESFVNIQKIEKEIREFRFEVNKKYLDVKNNLNLEMSLSIINKKMNLEIDYIQKYVDGALTEIVDKLDDTSNVVYKESKNIIYQDEKIYKENYKLTSENMFENMKNDFKKCEEMLNKVKENNLIVETETVKKEEYNVEETINLAFNTYIKFLNKENIFLSNNAKLKITSIKQSSDLVINSFSDVEYLYIKLSDILTNISDEFKIDSIISNIKTIQSLKDVINSVIITSNNLKII